jgi:nucleoside-diphosphate-sugar epimerase
MNKGETISILGCGWYGFSLATALIDKGFIVKGSTTSADKLQKLADANVKPYLVSFSADNETYDPLFFVCDVLWIAIPPKIRTDNGEDYLGKIKRIINAIKLNSAKQVVFISSTGVYGDSNAEINELSEPLPDSASGKALLQAETLLKQQTEFKTTIIRLAGLIGPGRDPGRFLTGKKTVPNGNAPVNLIHLTDCTGISCAILDKQAFGYTYNACSPSHPARNDFYTKAATRLGLEVPEFIAEQKNWKIVSSVNAEKILGYKYEIDDLMAWLDE